MGIERRAREYSSAAGPAPLWVYARPGEVPARTIVVAAGVHYDGPTDPRLDRVCRVLAASGARVVVPFVRDYMRLRVTPAVVEDFASAWQTADAAGLTCEGDRNGVFSVSFGALPAARLVTDPRFADRFSGLVTFGGYADFDAAFRFALTGQGDDGDRVGAHDPLNRPVAFATLIDHMPFGGDSGELRRRWVRYARRTWGRPEMKHDRRHEAVAHAEASGLGGEERDVFLLGCGVGEGGEQLCMEALAAADRTFTDPFAGVGALRARVTAVHGVDDDVIPPSQAHRIASRVRPISQADVHLTGLYGHTGGAGASPGALVRELRTMAAVVGALGSLGAGEATRRR